MIRLPALAPGAATRVSGSAVEELLLAREVYELAVVICLRGEDIAAFERNMTHLKALYFDYSDVLPTSAQMPLMFGLNLMRLLSENRIAEFHTELELLPQALSSKQAHSKDGAAHVSELLSSAPVAFSMRLEQDLMEGAYPRIERSRESMPHELFGVFLDRLMQTVRGEVADCMEKAYERIDVSYARKVLMLNDSDAWATFCAERGWLVSSDNSTIDFGEKKPSLASEIEDTVPTVEVMRRSIAYAKELERII